MLIENFNSLFSTYPGISELVKSHSCDELLSHVATAAGVDIQFLSNHPMGGYSKGKGLGSYNYVLKDLKQNITRYDQVYEMLADEESRQVYTALIQFRLFPDKQFIQKAYDGAHPQYFDTSIVKCSPKEVFVDCGGFTGDTAEAYIKQYKDYKHIYVYEPMDSNMQLCKHNLEKYENITTRQCGVGEKNELLPILTGDSDSSFAGNIESDTFIPIISLDEDISEPVTYIKMDIEGFEIPALLGAKNHIKNDTPKLAICTYHVLSDMWEIPLLIHSINRNYTYYFRHYMPNENWETVLYAIPKEKATPPYRKPKTAVALSWRDGWRNVELIKDCGLVPFLLHKNHDMDVTMVGAKIDDYTFLDTYVPGLKMEFLETGSVHEKEQYLLKHAEKIDLLILCGGYPTNVTLAQAYKYKNPNGKIYIGLDANSHWMDRIEWDSPAYVEFMSCCDVIATSCHAMQRHLNEKWPWKIETIQNGYYSFGKERPAPDFRQKKNTILTVSRLGTPQKATDKLLEAFALIADYIPDWHLKLVGTIEEEFENYIHEFFTKHPQLKERIHFTGVISDKDKLFEEYYKAKIFVLTSIYEGSPNVVAEALQAGCAMATTKFDAWEDLIDNGNCGMAVEIDDVSGIANMLQTLCTNDNLSELSNNAYQYALRNYDMEAIVSKLYEMIFGGDQV